MLTLELTTAGSSTGAVIAKEMLARLKVEKGEILFVTETPSGYLFTPYDPVIEGQIKLGREFALENRDALRALAK